MGETVHLGQLGKWEPLRGLAPTLPVGLRDSRSPNSLMPSEADPHWGQRLVWSGNVLAILKSMPGSGSAIGSSIGASREKVPSDTTHNLSILRRLNPRQNTAYATVPLVGSPK